MAGAVTVHGTKINGGFNSRKTTGYSLRQSLENQGVTTEAEMREHIRHVTNKIMDDPTYDYRTYRIPNP